MTDAPARRFRWSRLFLAILFSFALSEGLVRVAELVTGESWSLPELQEERDAVYLPHPYIGWIARPNYESVAIRINQVRTNNLGFRGEDIAREKPPRTLRIACLGGSTTWSTGASSNASTWPSVLERMLNEKLDTSGPYDRVEVINAGVSGYSLMESFINLKMRILPLDPDLVIIYHGVNDAQHLRRGDFKTDYSHVRATWHDRPPPSTTYRLLRWSHLYGLLLGPRRNVHRDTIARRLQVENYNQLPLRTGDQLAEGVQNFAWTLREAIALCRLHGVDVALATFAWAREGVGDKFIKKRSLVAALQQVNGAIKEVARRDKTLFVDMYRFGPNKLTEFDDLVHFNDSGNRLAAAIFAKRIRASGTLQR